MNLAKYIRYMYLGYGHTTFFSGGKSCVVPRDVLWCGHNAQGNRSQMSNPRFARELMLLADLVWNLSKVGLDKAVIDTLCAMLVFSSLEAEEKLDSSNKEWKTNQAQTLVTT